MSYKEQIDLNRIPKHVAIIMDGGPNYADTNGVLDIRPEPRLCISLLKRQPG